VAIVAPLESKENGGITAQAALIQRELPTPYADIV
jgi:hypothetical protein